MPFLSGNLLLMIQRSLLPSCSWQSKKVVPWMWKQ